MKKFTPLLILLLTLLLGVAALFQISQRVQAQPQAAATGLMENWRMGVTLEGVTDYRQISGRMITNAAIFSSNHAVQDVYYFFPAPAALQTLSAARFNVLTQAGTASGVNK